MKKYTRKRKLIKPAMQLKLAGIFMLTAISVTLVQAYTLDRIMVRVAGVLPNDGAVLNRIWPEYFTTNLVLTLLLIVLTIYGVGVAITHKLAGPVHRMEVYLRDVQAGRAVQPCKLRKGDELQEFCALLNETTEPLRAKASAPAQPTSQREAA